MNTKAKIWITVGGLLILLGCIIFAGAMSTIKWDFSKLSTDKYEENKHEINEPFSALSFDTDTADVTLIPSDDSSTSIVCYERENEKHSVSVKDGVLTVELTDSQKWYEYIGINFESPKITVYLPAGDYGELSVKSDTGDVKIPKDFAFESIEFSASTGDIENYASASKDIKIETTTGDVRLDGVSAESISITVSTGDSNLANITCKNLVSRGSTGDISLKNVVAIERFLIERSTGDVKLDACDAADISITTDTGDVSGSLLSEKDFVVNTDTGEKDVTDTARGGRCEITTDTGDVKITIE